MRGIASPRPLAEVMGMLQTDERAKSIPTLLPDEIESLPDSYHPGYNDHYYWRDKKKLEIDANRCVLVCISRWIVLRRATAARELMERGERGSVRVRRLHSNGRCMAVDGRMALA